MGNDSLVPYGQVLPEVSQTPEEILSQHLSIWETRGRGWTLADSPVELEPPFCPLYYLLSVPEAPILDDGKRQSFWSELFSGGPPDNSAALQTYRQQIADYQSLIQDASEPLFCRYYAEGFVELQLVLPKDLKLSKQAAENLLLSFNYLSHPVGFEVIGNSSEIVIQFAVTEKDLPQVRQQLAAHLPGYSFRETTDYLYNLWITGDSEALIVDFGLSHEFMLPLKTASYFETDSLVTVIGALADLREDEVGVFQVLFQKARNDWAQEIMDSALYFEETGAFAKASNASSLAKEKTRSPLFAVCARIAGRSFNEARTWQIIKGLGAGFSNLSNPLGNELIPLSNDDYPEEYHEQALLSRLSFRSGMILNLEELVSIVHPPSALVRSEKLQRETEKTIPAPGLALNNALVLGENYHQTEVREVSLSNEQRTKHIHLIGSSGSGKSTLLLNLIKQDLENGEGFCVIDPHGDLIDLVIEHIPDSRIKDVILFDPSDAEFPVGFNILQANSELEKTLLSSDLIATFRRLSTSWGDVMDSVLANAILAFVESERGGTLFDLKRFLVEKDFRSDFLESVTDQGIKYFWQKEFPLISGKPQSSILIRLDTFLRQKLIRNIVCQKENKINFRDVMDRRKILLIKLSQGAIGEENSYLLGTLLVSKLYQTALSRQDTQSRPFFSCYLDEFHHFITPSMESVLSGVRKYNLGLVLAHQEFRQLQSRNAEVASSVLSNCYTRICFRLGDTDAEKFASGFSFFDAKALQNLGVGETIARIERSDYDFNLKIELLPKVAKETARQRRDEVLRHSREKYGAPRAEVEAAVFVSQANTAPSAEIKDAAQTSVTEIRHDASVMKNAVVEQQEKSVSSPPETFLSDSNSLPLSEVSDKQTQQHKYLQSLVKRIGENKGFVAVTEKEVFGGAGRIDVALENEALRIAVEISVTNGAEYEVQNIQKCLAAEYDTVIMLSADARHLEKIRQKAEEILSPESFAMTKFFSPEAFHSWIENLDNESSQKSEKVKGFKVNVKLKPVEGAERATRKKAISNIVFGALKKLRKDDSEK